MRNSPFPLYLVLYSSKSWKKAKYINLTGQKLDEAGSPQNEKGN